MYNVRVQPILPQSIKVYTYLHARNNAVAFFSFTIQSPHDFGTTCVLFSPKGCWGPGNAYFHYTFTIWHYCESTTSSFHEESDWESGKQHWISKVLSQVQHACFVLNAAELTVLFILFTVNQLMHNILKTMPGVDFKLDKMSDSTEFCYRLDFDLC